MLRRTYWHFQTAGPAPTPDGSQLHQTCDWFIRPAILQRQPDKWSRHLSIFTARRRIAHRKEWSQAQLHSSSSQRRGAPTSVPFPRCDPEPLWHESAPGGASLISAVNLPWSQKETQLLVFLWVLVKTKLVCFNKPGFFASLCPMAKRYSSSLDDSMVDCLWCAKNFSDTATTV